MRLEPRYLGCYLGLDQSDRPQAGTMQLDWGAHASRVPRSRLSDVSQRPEVGKPNSAEKFRAQSVFGATPNTARETRALP